MTPLWVATAPPRRLSRRWLGPSAVAPKGEGWHGSGAQPRHQERKANRGSTTSAAQSGADPDRVSKGHWDHQDGAAMRKRSERCSVDQAGDYGGARLTRLGPSPLDD